MAKELDQNMPLLGAHMSVAGGIYKAAEESAAHQCQTVQVFTKNANQWKGKPLTQEDIDNFRRAAKKADLKHNLSHNSYLINLASPDDELFAKSIEAFVDEMERAEQLELDYLVAHPGAHVKTGEEAGIKRIANGLDEIHRRCSDFKVMILLEITAGQGSTLGYKFDHMGQIFKQTKHADKLGICFDTCHAFAAGYPLFPKVDYDATWQEFDTLIGINKLKAFHLNDSKKGLGSRVDRHEHIGKGALGIEPFRLILNDPRFANLPMVLETPKEEGDNHDMDGVNLTTLRDLLQSN